MIRHCSVISVYVMMYKVQSGIYNSTCSTIELIIRSDCVFMKNERDIISCDAFKQMLIWVCNC
jgi:hypothetical protein